MRPRRQHVRAVLRLELCQSRVVYDPQQDLAHVERFPDIRVHDGKNVFRGIPGWEGRDKIVGQSRRHPHVQRRDPFAGLLNGVESVVTLSKDTILSQSSREKKGLTYSSDAI